MSEKKNILMIVENNFPNDSRVRKEAEVLRERYGVTVVSLKNKKTEKRSELWNGIRIYRIPELPDFKPVKIRYVLEYFYFTLAAAAIFLATFPAARYKVIHVHNPPDTLFFVGLLGKLFGVKFVYDHHDLAPELYLSRFSGRKDIVYNGLVLCEKMSCKLANVVISTNESYKRIEMARHGIGNGKIRVVRNNPILDECSCRQTDDGAPKSCDRTKLLFLGSINPQDGLEVLLETLHCLVYDLNRRDFLCTVVGGGDSLDAIRRQAKEMGLEDFIEFKGKVFDRDEVKTYLSAADIGVEPAPLNELNRHSTFIKVMEYMAAAKPVVAFDLEETRYSTNGSALLVPPGDIRAFAQALAKLLDDPVLRTSMGNAGKKRVSSELTWGKASVQLIEAYKALPI